MPRRSSVGASAPRPRHAAHAPVRNPPQPGLAFGTGSAIAHRAVDSVLGPRVIHHETVTSSAPGAAPASTPNTGSLGGVDACSGQFKALQDCLNNYGSDISKCQFYMDMLQECRRSSGAALSA
ncbi:hypothetical protein JRO89_XS07G0108900 [Xanthoceras sorbifolium]|uniref:CHCH domain-containing protein n=1 Tax=Xanthoceras sorbifolium TaxID=99658 RepID=A0ABQ8HTD0_9ROSI|nr:hypothetical protein JRO89_XS07G0108900 [Xanthoceras sorbifolium]